MSVCLSSGLVCCHPHTNTCTGANAIHRRKRALSDKKVLGNAYRAVLSRAPEHRVSLTCTDCGEIFSACVATPPADAAWACEACDSAKPELMGVLGGSWVGSARGGGSGHIAPLDCARIESEWLRFHADETRHLRDVGKRVQTMKDLAAELAAEQKTADVALAEAEKRHAALGQRKFDLANKKMRLLDLVRRVAGADAVRVHRETAAAADVAAETQAAAERAAAAFLAAAGQNPTSSSAAAADAAAASADAHGAAAAATAGDALPMRFPVLKLLPEQTALHSVSATVSDGAALLTYSPQPYSSAPVVSSVSAAAAAATAYQYASALPRLVSYPSLVASMEGHDVDGHDGDAMDIDLTPLPQPTPNGVGPHSTAAGNGAAQRAYGGAYHEP
jgi:hypothetical protein